MKFNKFYDMANGVEGGGSGGNAVTFNFEQYNNVVTQIETKRNLLVELAQKTLNSVDYQSGPAKDALDAKLNEIPKSADGIVAIVNEMITSMKNVSANYADRQSNIASALGSGGSGATATTANRGGASSSSFNRVNL